MGEVRGYNSKEAKAGETISIAELAKNPIRASDMVQDLMKVGKYDEAKELLLAVLVAQQNEAKRGKGEVEQRMAV